MNVKIFTISLGCARNLVDSESLLGDLLSDKSNSLVTSRSNADVIIINTCAFTREARTESLQAISSISESKSRNQILIVCGCLPQLQKRELFQRFPEIDAVFGSADFKKIRDVLPAIVNGSRIFEVSHPPLFLRTASMPRLISTPPSYAYLKISEGCSNHCSYCLIPYLRGEHRARSVDDIVTEAKQLVQLGVQELILIGQDTTLYNQSHCEEHPKGATKQSHPTNIRADLVDLLSHLDRIRGLRWIRLLYAHPAHFSKRLINAFGRFEKLVKYVDLPIQHTHDEILKRMNRPSFALTRRVIDELRARIPELSLRTTVIVGFPGETDEHFRKLLKNVEEIQFDWLGAFKYSKERGTGAYKMKAQVPSKIKEKRWQQIMSAQQKITFRKNQARIGKTLPVLADTAKEGHSTFQAPEIDGKVIFKRRRDPGAILRARITGASGYDLLSF